MGQFLAGGNTYGKGALHYLYLSTHLDEAEQWLLRRADEQGMHLIRHEIQLEKILVRRRPEPHSRDIRLTVCKYQGLLEVVEAAQFTEGLAEGIGKKKIFGLGIMMLAKA